MRILVTGGAGFLGRHVAHALVSRGDTVTVLDDLSCSNSAFDVPELQHPAITCIRATTLDTVLLGRMVPEHDAIFHLASVVGVEETIRHPFETMRNLEGTLNVVEALRPSQAIVFTSSADVYGLHSHLYDQPMHEDDLQLFESSDVNRWVYPKVKSLEENAVLHGPGRGAVVRVFNCFGPGMDFPHGKRVVPQFIERILCGLPLRVSGTGEQRRAMCFYTDTVRGVLAALQYLLDDPGATPIAVNIGSDETWSVLELADTLQELAIETGLLEQRLPVERHAKLYSQTFDDSWHRVPDLKRAATLLGYAPRVAAREGLRRTLEYYAASQAGAQLRHERAAVVVARRPAAALGVFPARRDATVVDTDVLILGGGISGLSCRAGLAGERDSLLLEAAGELGGLLRVYPHGDYVFDTTVHAIFFQNPRLRQLFEDLLPAGFHEFDKQNLIWQAGQVIDYPYQFHLRQVPGPIRARCLAGVPEAPGRGVAADCSFEAWLVAQFGRGLYNEFFQPYNTKLYGVPLASLEAGPMVWTIPVDNRAAILDGADGAHQTRERRVRCLYPRGRAGIAAIAQAMAARSTAPVHCGERVVAVDPVHRVVETASGRRVRYRELVNTLPLPQFIAMCRGTSASLRAAAATLDAAAITVVQLGLPERGPGLDAHWTYFPDADVPFYRLTRLERISPDLCPAGASALLLECAGDTPPDRARVLEVLQRLDVISSPAVDWYGTLRIPNAYVLFRRGSGRVLQTLHAALEENGIRTIGRFGEWRYANIEQCVVSGLDAARALVPAAATVPLLERLRLAVTP